MAKKTQDRFTPEFRAGMIEAYAAYALELPDQPVPKTAERKAKRRAKLAEFVSEAWAVCGRSNLRPGLVRDPEVKRACGLLVGALSIYVGDNPTADPWGKGLDYLRRETVRDDLKECRRIMQGVTFKDQTGGVNLADAKKLLELFEYPADTDAARTSQLYRWAETDPNIKVGKGWDANLILNTSR
ncbi:MAG: hypothetical protein R3C45_09210 [Phycisphaerales bacterium]